MLDDFGHIEATVFGKTANDGVAQGGAGSGVVTDVPPYALMVGNPAKQKGWVSRAGWTLDFDKNGKAVCQETGEKYTLKDGVLKPED